MDIHTCNEFAMFSDGVNAIVEAIGKKMTETQALLEHQQAASIQMGSIAEKLRALSDGNLSTADRLYNGAAEQTTTIRHLTESLHQGMTELDQLAVH